MDLIEQQNMFLANKVELLEGTIKQLAAKCDRMLNILESAAEGEEVFPDEQPSTGTGVEAEPIKRGRGRPRKETIGTIPEGAQP